MPVVLSGVSVLPHFCFFPNPTMFGENVLHGPSVPNHQQGLIRCANRREVTETPEDPGWSPGEPCHLTPWAGGGGVQGSGVNPGCRRACWRVTGSQGESLFNDTSMGGLTIVISSFYFS